MNKSIVILILITLFCINKSFSQYSDTSRYKFHLENAKISNRTGSRLLIVGGSCIAVGTSMVILLENDALTSNNHKDSHGDVYKYLGAIIVSIAGIGGGTIISLASIPHFITGYNQRKKAMQFQPIINTINISGKPINTVGIKVSF